MRLFLVEGKPGEPPRLRELFCQKFDQTNIFLPESGIQASYTHTCTAFTHTHTHTNTYMNTYIHGVATISRPLENMSLLQNTGLFCRALLQKRPKILRSLLIAGTPQTCHVMS